MKKGFLLLFVICCVFVFAGCGSNLKTMKCSVSSNIEGNSTTSSYEVKHDGEYVSKIELVETITSSDQSVLSQYEQYLNNLYSSSSATYGGYTYKVTNNGSKVVSNVTMDYTKMDLNKLVQDDPSFANYVKDGKLTLSGIKEMYSQYGITCEN